MNIAYIADKVDLIKQVITKNLIFIFIVVVAAIFSFLTFQIKSYSNAKPSEQQIQEKYSKTTKLQLDEEAVDKINVLQDKKINIEALFDNGRSNPFE